jgi:hypothetical protein
MRAGEPHSGLVNFATFGLLAVIQGASRSDTKAPWAVASYITAAYWFTASTSFANPAVTIARSLSDTFAGIRPADVPLFVSAQIAGALSATLLLRRLAPRLPPVATAVAAADLISVADVDGRGEFRFAARQV